MDKNVCVECRWCLQQIDPEHGSSYRCGCTHEPLSVGDLIRRPACGNFELPPPAPHWGA